MTEYHSPLGGSIAHRFINCPGSMRMSAGAGGGESVNANMGTVAHTLAATCMETDTDAWEHIGCRPDARYDILVDKDMADAVQVYLDYLRYTLPSCNETYVEEVFNEPGFHAHFSGTADFVGVTDDTVVVVDYKHGQGVVVEAVNNAQLMYYALGTVIRLWLWDRERIHMAIVQPRAPHSFGPIRTWEIGIEQLERWGDDVLGPAMDKAMWSHETRVGPWCQFCPGLTKQCKAMQRNTVRVKELMDIPIEELTPEQMAEVMQLGEIFKKRLYAVSRAALARAESGTEIPGYKIVKARGNRQFRDDAPLEKSFGRQAFLEPKLKTPAQIDKLPFGKEFTTRWAFAPETGNKLVPTDDSRPAQGPAQKSMFKPVEESK